jgi:hypothetical protein
VNTPFLSIPLLIKLGFVPSQRAAEASLIVRSDSDKIANKPIAFIIDSLQRRARVAAELALSARIVLVASQTLQDALIGSPSAFSSKSHRRDNERDH